MNHSSSDELNCKGPTGDVLTAINCSIIAYLVLTLVVTLAILLFTYVEAKKKFEQLENAYGSGYGGSSSDPSEFEPYYEDEEFVDISDMYEVIPEDIQKKEERRRKRFGSGQNFDILGQIVADDDEDKEELEEEEYDEEGGDSGREDSRNTSRNPSDESVLESNHLTRPRMSLNTETSESTSNKSSRRTSDESDCLPIRPQPRFKLFWSNITFIPRSYFQNLPPPRHLKPPKPLCRTESKTRADYLLRMMSSPELFNANDINSNTPPQKRYSC